MVDLGCLGIVKEGPICLRSWNTIRVRVIQVLHCYNKANGETFLSISGEGPDAIYGKYECRYAKVESPLKSKTALPTQPGK